VPGYLVAPLAYAYNELAEMLATDTRDTASKQRRPGMGI
jgi:hypothetical protein